MSNLDDRLAEALDEPKANFLKSLKENKFALWTLIILAIGSLVGSSLFFGQKTKREKDFFVFESLKQGSLDAQSIVSLKKYGQKYPELDAQINNILAKSFMLERQSDKARSIAKTTLSEDYDVHSFYKEFSKTSFLIEDHKWGEALALALTLKEDMISDHSIWQGDQMNAHFGGQVFLFNLLRICSIYRELGNVSEEHQALKQLNAYMGDESKLPQSVVEKFQDHLSLGRVSLSDFIHARENVLSR